MASDPEKQVDWDKGNLIKVEKLTPEPLQKGSRYRGKFKGMGSVSYEFVFDPPKRFAHSAKLPFGRIRHIFTLDAVPEGTQLTKEGILNLNPLGWLMVPMLKRMLRRRFRAINTELREYLVGK